MRVLVVAESPVVRAGLEAILAREPDVTIVGDAPRDTATMAQQLEEHEPDVVLLELGPDDDDPATAYSLLLGALSDATRAAMVVIAESADAALVAEALRAGVRAVLSRGASGEEILAATRAAAAGLAVFPAPLAEPLLGATRSHVGAEPHAAEAELTPRELDVLRLLAEGLGNKQIAGRLGLSDHTVKFHVGSIFQKLHASTRTEAVTLGLRRGLLLL